MPSLMNLFLLVVFGAFLIAGVWMGIDGGGLAPLGIVAFGIAGLAVAIRSTVDERTNRRLRDVSSVELPGGVPFSATRARRAGVFLLCVLMFGVPPFTFGAEMPVLIVFLSVAMGGIAALALVLDLVGLLPRPSITFLPKGFLVANGRGKDYLVPWDNVRSVAEGKYARNEAVFLDLVDAGRVELSPKFRPESFAKLIGWNRGFADVDLVLMCLQFGMTGGELARAIATYVNDPSKRARLETSLPPAR